MLSSCAGAAKTTADAAVRVKNAVAKENFIMEDDNEELEKQRTP